MLERTTEKGRDRYCECGWLMDKELVTWQWEAGEMDQGHSACERDNLSTSMEPMVEGENNLFKFVLWYAYLHDTETRWWWQRWGILN